MKPKKSHLVYIPVPKSFADETKIVSVKKGFNNRSDFFKCIEKELKFIDIKKNKKKEKTFEDEIRGDWNIF